MFSGDGSKFAVLEDNRIKIYATSSGLLLLQCVEPQHLSTAYVCMAWSPKVCFNRSLFFFFFFFFKPSDHIFFPSLQGSSRELIALGTESGVVVVWDVAKGSILSELGAKGTGHAARVRCVAFAAPTRVLSVGDDRQCCVWECSVSSSALLSRFECQSAGPALVVAAGAEGSAVVGGSQLGEWDAMSGKPLRQLSGGHAAPVSLLAFVGEESTLASGAGDRFICLWRKTGKEILAATQPISRICGGQLGVVAVSEDGSKVFFWQDSNVIAEEASAPSKSSKKSKTTVNSSSKAREPFATLVGNNHPVLDVIWDRADAALVARLVGGRPQFFRVAPGADMPAVDLLPGGSNLEAVKNVAAAAVDGLSAFSAPLRIPQASANAGLNAGGAGTVVGIIRQALLTRDNVLLGEALSAPVKPEDSCRALDSRLACPLLAALTARLERGMGDVRTLEWIKALLKEHRTTIGATTDGDGSLEMLKTICDRATHSMKRLLRLRGKLELLETSGPTRSVETKLVTWDEREAAG